MHDRLRAARTAGTNLRFAGDIPLEGTDQSSRSETVRCHFYQSALRVSPEVTPALYDKLAEVCGRLLVPTEAVEAFVSSSPEIQAECYAGTRSECVLRFSSALIDVLDEDEFAFVAGHELGHFLLDHRSPQGSGEGQNLEGFMLQRAQEISVDRFGLVACQSLDVAVKALMKTISGLNNKHLRFDIGAFISQLRRLSDPTLAGSESASHPSILVRCRALLWFSLETGATGGEIMLPDAKAKLDERVQADLTRYVDGPARRRIAAAKENLGIWIAANEMLRDGKFDKQEQAAFAQMFGAETLHKLKEVIRESSASDLRVLFSQNAAAAEKQFRELIPVSADLEIASMRRSITSGA